MVAVCILLLSVGVLAEFSVMQWRSVWLTVAAQPLSAALSAATGIANEAISAGDFERLVATSRQLSPAPRETKWLKEVGAYYRVMKAVESLGAKHAPAVSAWAQKELVSCSRFAAAILDQRIQANMAFATSVQGY